MSLLDAGQLGIGVHAPIAGRLALQVAILPAGLAMTVDGERARNFLMTGWSVLAIFEVSNHLELGLGYLGQAVVGEARVPARANFCELAIRVPFGDHWIGELFADVGWGENTTRDRFGRVEIEHGVASGGGIGVTHSW
jgi:hypothetical protein